MEYGSESGGVWNMALRWLWRCVEYDSESGGVWNMNSEIGGVWNMSLRVEVCGIWF